MEFERTSRRTIRSLPLVPMIDIMFILIIFFMLTTTFMKIESLELMLPSVAGKTPEKTDVMPTIAFDRFYRYAELTTTLQALARERSDLVSIESIGKSHEGRDIWVLTVTNRATGPAAETKSAEPREPMAVQHKGPPRVTSDAYRGGWEMIFGNKRRDPGDAPN